MAMSYPHVQHHNRYKTRTNIRHVPSDVSDITRAAVSLA